MSEDKLEELAEINAELLKVRMEKISALSGNEGDRQKVEHRRGFLEGRAYEITSGMEQHPEYWSHFCNCDQCGDRA